MFDIDEFIGECRAAVAETEPRRAVRDVLARAVSEPAAVGDALAPTEGGITLVHQAPDLTVVHVVWAPGMRIFPHNHNMWAAIGIYAGQEDNEFFRRAAPGRPDLEASGGRELREQDVILLGDDTIHAVTNPLTRLTAAIHVYGGDFVNEPRSQWAPGLADERPYDIDSTRQQFADANAAWRAAGTAEPA
jgi:predicted metal-dependent enzyme (double-stranded beta helix superfamily)